MNRSGPTAAVAVLALLAALGVAGLATLDAPAAERTGGTAAASGTPAPPRAGAAPGGSAWVRGLGVDGPGDTAAADAEQGRPGRSRLLRPRPGTAGFEGADLAPARPVRVSVPRLGIASRLDRLRIDPAGALERPPRWQVAGWFAGGPRPGDTGPAVIAGHVDSPTGPAVFAGLSAIRPGDRVRVEDADGVVRTFVVDAVTSTPKQGFPTRAVYGATPDPQLRLITCTGAYDSGAGGYQDNLLVFAHLLRG